jgi:hypothetical protein
MPWFSDRAGPVAVYRDPAGHEGLATFNSHGKVMVASSHNRLNKAKHVMAW